MGTCSMSITNPLLGLLRRTRYMWLFEEKLLLLLVYRPANITVWEIWERGVDNLGGTGPAHEAGGNRYPRDWRSRHKK